MSRDVPTLDARGSCHCSRHEPRVAPLEKGDDGNMGPSGPVDVWRHLELPFCLLDFVPHVRVQRFGRGAVGWLEPQRTVCC